MTREGRRRIGRSGLLMSAAAGAVVALVATVALSSPRHPRTVALKEPDPALTSSTTAPTTTTATPTTTATTRTTTKVAATTTTKVAPRPTPGGALDGCPNLPADNVWHTPVTSLPVLSASSRYVAGIGAGSGVHADFGSGDYDGGPIGIPVTYVSGSQPMVAVHFSYADESDPGPYPIPANAAVEGGSNSDGDRHVLVVDTGTCTLYELYNAHPNSDGSWQAGSGAVYHLTSDQLRPKGWTSADAAGLPITPGLVRYEEVAAGHIDHAIRVTVPRSQAAFLWPARHQASSSTDSSLPPMGLRLRLKADVDISGLPQQARVIAQAMKTEGVIVADNGSAWYISGAPDPRWNNDELQTLGTLHGNDFEAIDTSGPEVDANSGKSR
ncbi:MAG TPA: hypothetical protein VFX16_23435 [Pseudonocardiaceae bacterium]|nr:hypothetical protein [Pseudonocardiaceae bacterium]